MLWKIAIHGGHLHPDFIRDKLTDRQLHEIAWYHHIHPFGHDIDHLMFSRIIASFAGGKPEDYMPKLKDEATVDSIIGGMTGISEFMADNDIEAEYGDD
jgi:hypothetical protein